MGGWLLAWLDDLTGYGLGVATALPGLLLIDNCCILTSISEGWVGVCIDADGGPRRSI